MQQFLTNTTLTAIMLLKFFHVVGFPKLVLGNDSKTQVLSGISLALVLPRYHFSLDARLWRNVFGSIRVSCAIFCAFLIKVLIGDEPEEGMENLMEVEIPKDVEEKLIEMDAKEQEQMEKDKQESEKNLKWSPEGLEG